MTTINTNNSIGMNINATYSSNNSSQSEIQTLQKERQSLQKELQSLQSNLASNSLDSETIQVEIDTLQSQISTIDSKISTLQSKTNEKSSTDNQSYAGTKINNNENLEVLKNTLVTLNEVTKILENEIALDKGRGLNAENKNDILSNMKENINSISTKFKDIDEKNLGTDKINSQINLIGNIIDDKA